MANPSSDERSPERRAQDARIAAEPQMPPPDLPSDAQAAPLETHLRKRSHPVAVVGVVENGVVRPLDPTVTLPELSRVIIVASEETQ